MPAQPPPFDPNELAEWLVQGLKETLSYRFKKAIDRERLMDLLKSKVPNRNQVVHLALRQAFQQGGFSFEELKQGDALFYMIRKKFRTVPEGQTVRRLLLIPGFGDSPGSWLFSFGFAKRELAKRFDEILLVDFPGYSGFLAKHEMVSSMTMLLSVINTVCEHHPPTVIVGHSLGGWLAGKVSQNLRKPLEHLFLMAPSGLIPEFERKAFGDFIVKNQDLEVEELLGLIMHEPKRYHEMIKDDLKAFYSRKQVKEFVESVKSNEFINPSLPFRAKKLTVVWGENDRFVPSQWIRYWVESYGEYLDAYLLKETGHVPQIECPRTTAQVFLHALLGKESTSGQGWRKIQSRKKDFNVSPNLTHDPSSKFLT